MKFGSAYIVTFISEYVGVTSKESFILLLLFFFTVLCCCWISILSVDFGIEYFQILHLQCF